MMDFSSLFEAEAHEKVELEKPPREIRWQPILFGVILLPIFVLVGWFGFLFLRPNLEGLLNLIRQPAVQAGVVPTATESQMALVFTPTDTLAPTVTPPPATATVTPSSNGCLNWSEVRMEDVNRKICVEGEFIRHFQREDGTYVMLFSEDAGTFQVWSFPKPFEWYLKGKDKNCVIVEGWVQTSGVRPIIILGSKGTLEACP